MSGHDPNSPRHLKHYFHDVNQQYETSKFAMWAFILTEVLTFAGLFVAYIVYRSWSVSYTHLTLPTTPYV